jgi:hypothetical protein
MQFPKKKKKKWGSLSSSNTIFWKDRVCQGTGINEFPICFDVIMSGRKFLSFHQWTKYGVKIEKNAQYLSLVSVQLMAQAGSLIVTPSENRRRGGNEEASNINDLAGTGKWKGSEPRIVMCLAY